MGHIKTLQLSELQQTLGKKHQSLIMIVDDRINQHYRKYFELLQCPRWVAPSGEEAKSFKSIIECCDFFLQQGINRQTHLVAIGGGATSDMAGFVSSILLRGISWTVVPTTLLAMVDASIGGKTAINSTFGKNLIGTFHLPDEVLICHEFLNSLPRNQVISGMGELIKYGFLSSEIQKDILAGADFIKIVESCAAFKDCVVSIDPKEQNERMMLNLGHTFGHALEKQYSLEHGIAVLGGLYLVFELFHRKHDLELLKTFKNKLITEKINLSINDKDWDELTAFILRDKKNKNPNSVTFVLMDQFVLRREVISIETLHALIDKNLKGRCHDIVL